MKRDFVDVILARLSNGLHVSDEDVINLCRRVRELEEQLYMTYSVIHKTGEKK